MFERSVARKYRSHRYFGYFECRICCKNQYKRHVGFIAFTSISESLATTISRRIAPATRTTPRSATTSTTTSSASTTSNNNNHNNNNHYFNSGCTTTYNNNLRNSTVTATNRCRRHCECGKRHKNGYKRRIVFVRIRRVGANNINRNRATATATATTARTTTISITSIITIRARHNGDYYNSDCTATNNNK